MTQRAPTQVILHPGSKRVAFIISLESPDLHPLPLGEESSGVYVTDSFFQASLSPITPCQPSPSGLFSSMPSRFLLTAVALLSSYSIHLLLKSSGIVGKLLAGLQRGGAKVKRA